MNTLFKPIPPPYPARLLAMLGLSLFLGLTGCSGLPPLFGPESAAMTEPDPGPDEPEPPAAPADPGDENKPPPVLYEWRGDGRRVSRIVIDTNEQKARFYAGGEEIGWSTVATGISSYPTPIGRFAVLEKTAEKRSNLYGKVVGRNGQVIKSNARAGRDPVPPGARFEGARMPYFMRLTHDGVGLHAGPIPRPGQPASHGCIRMPAKLAPVLFQHVNHGTEVAIVGKGPNYGDYVEKQRAIAAAAERRRAEQQAAAAALAARSAETEQMIFDDTNAPDRPPAATVVAQQPAPAAAPRLHADAPPAAPPPALAGPSAPPAPAVTPPANLETPPAVQPPAMPAAAGPPPEPRPATLSVPAPVAPPPPPPAPPAATVLQIPTMVQPVVVAPPPVPALALPDAPPPTVSVPAPTAPTPVATPAPAPDQAPATTPAPAPDQAPAATPVPAPDQAPAATPVPVTIPDAGAS